MNGKPFAFDPTPPLTGEEMETAIRELARDPKTSRSKRKRADHGPLSAQPFERVQSFHEVLRLLV